MNHATYQDVAAVSVFVGTFNMGRENAKTKLAANFTVHNHPHLLSQSVFELY